MKNMFKKHGMVVSIGGFLGILGLLLAIISAFIKKDTVALTMAILGCLAIIVGLFMMALNAKENKLFKMIGIFILAAFLFTWILPYGYFQGTDFYDYGMNRIGLGDLGTSLYYALYFSLDKIIYLFVIGGFYGVLSTTNGYKSLVSGIAKRLKNNVIVTSVIFSLLIVALSTILSQSFTVLIFIPFFVSILSHMKVDRLSTFAITFGSALIGILGATYGTESLMFFNKYLGTEISVGLTYRAIVLLVAFVLYNFFIVMRLKKVLKDKSLEKVEDPFAFETPKKSSGKIPAAIVLFIITVMTILGYVTWSNWEIEVFTNFHTWLTELKIGEDFTIMSYILGQNALAFGSFELMTIINVLLIGCALLALMNRVKLDDFIQSFYEGAKKMIKPALMFFGIYVVFVFCYMSPFVPTITNWLLELTDNFNPITTSIAAFISSAFHTDLGYTAYTLGTYLTTAYAGDLDIVHTIYITMYGIVQIFLPTSAILMIGLSLMDVDYKSWFKYIWLFVVGMIIILLVLFTVVTYI